MVREVSAKRRKIILGGAGAVAVAAFLAVTGTAFAESAATGEVRAAGGPTAVSGSYIVVLPETAAVSPAAKRLTARYGGAVRREFGDAVRGFEVSMSPKAARRLAADRSIAYVEQVHTVSIQETQANPPSVGLDRIDQRNLPLNNSYTFPTRATNVRAYIIDTGIRTTHQDFGGRAVSGFDAVDGGVAQDCNGHGTHVAGTVGGTRFGVAKGVQLVAVRVLDCNGSGTSANVIAGIDFVTRDARGRAAVANMSLGGGVSTAIDAAVRRSVAAGVTYAVAAGNSNANACGSSPARVPEAVTVGATGGANGRSDARASFSNFGTCLDIFAPGVGIVSATNANDTGSRALSGTSMSTPHVTGAAAMVKSANPGFTPAQVRDRLVARATPNVVIGPGTGSPNRLLFVG
jgi:subtilisin family serine protease